MRAAEAIVVIAIGVGLPGLVGAILGVRLARKRLLSQRRSWTVCERTTTRGNVEVYLEHPIQNELVVGRVAFSEPDHDSKLWELRARAHSDAASLNAR